MIQIGVKGEESIVPDHRLNLSLRTITELVKQCDTFISVDSFLPHLARHVPKFGVVVWSVSDPLIFGYPENTNLIKSRSYLRARQFGLWEEQDYNPEAFVSPSAVLYALGAL